MAACGGGGGGGSPSATPPLPLGPPVTYTVSGTVSGMFGTGLVLTNNGLDNRTVNANGSFTFATALPSGFPYSVQVQTPPSPAQLCTVANGSGTLSGNVTNVQVTCANTIGGTVSGASFTVVLQNNGGDDKSTGNGSFTFATTLTNGAAYNVTVLSSNPAQQCTVTNGSGTANGNVTNVQVVCKNTIGGTVSGLSGTVVLQNNGGDDKSISANGPFTFATAITTGSAYNVTVLTQPSVPAQTCQVANGSGTAGANITSVQITCTNGQWTWIKGSNVANQASTYGTQGTPAAGNTPGAKFGSASWTDASTNLWLFGGFGYLPDGIQVGYQNELWKFSGGQWTWVNGVNTLNPSGTYGTKGTAAAANVPGGRVNALNWTDSSGNLWLFGGQGFDSAGFFGELNDLWKYSISTGQWTWVSGANTRNQKGTYSGPAASLVPGARHFSEGWIDASGNLFLFGGFGLDSAGTTDELNDLWKYTVSTDRWTFIGGSNVVDSAGTYGTKGVAALTNIPGARHGAVSWKDAGGNMWLFGGFGCDSGGCVPLGKMNDLWKFDGAQWTWVNGSNVHDQPGVYGTLGTADPANVPGARFLAAGWTDGSGNLWLFGGQGSAAVCCGVGELTDLWKYTIGTGNWTWASGSIIPNLNGTYGAQGAVAVGFPGSRHSAASWIDASGDLWLFGGMGDGGSGTSGDLNDLWRFRPQ